VTFKLTAKQEEAQAVCAGGATHVMLFGGSRSGKTFLHTRNTVFRALKAPGSRHAILRFRFNHVKASIVLDTFPKCMALAFPGVQYHIDKSDWFARLPGDSQIWFGGLDDKERTEKILGQEHATIYLNECSQIPQNSRDMAATRLAQLVQTHMEGRAPGMLKPRMYYDCNPPSKAHWSYRMFVQKVDPETKQPLAQPADYAHFQMNPEDNADNLAPGYLDTLRSLSPRLRKRFLQGEFADATPNQLFTDENLETWRVMDGKLPDYVRVVVSVDPSGSGDSDNADNDAIGIVVAALGTDGNAYVLEDLTVKAGPATWGKIAADAFERHGADCIVGETNYGGAMVEATIQAIRREQGQRRAPYKAVTATRGKVVRAEPISALYEQGKVRHVGYHRDLEDELTAFSTVGYTGGASPNRADALIWGLTELFPGIVAQKKERKPREHFGAGAAGWMA
jgi:predicted phage terminase large subunit-like protein